MIECDEIISVMDIVSTKTTNSIATNIPKTCHNKNSKKLSYVAYSFISDHITIDNYNYLLSLCKTKKH